MSLRIIKEYNEKTYKFMSYYKKKYNINFSCINPIIDVKNQSREFQYDLIYLINKSIELECITDEILMFYEFVIGKKLKYKCNAGIEQISIFPDGDIYPCHAFAINKTYKTPDNIYN